MINLSKKLGEMNYDGLVTDIQPAPIVRGGTIAHLKEAATYVRGTILGHKKEDDGKLYIMAEGGEVIPSCVLCDDIEIGTSDDVTVPVYFSGCFDPEKLTTKDGYALVAADIDNLRVHGIHLKAALSDAVSE